MTATAIFRTLSSLWLFLGSVTLVHAQDTKPQTATVQDTGGHSSEIKELSTTIDSLRTRRVRSIHPVVTVDPVTKIATVELYNPDIDTACVDLDAQFPEPPQQSLKADAVLALTSEQVDSMNRVHTVNDSLEKEWSLIPWIVDGDRYPKRILIGPGQTLTLKIQLRVPANVKPGTYSGHIAMQKVMRQNVGMQEMFKAQVEDIVSTQLKRPVKVKSSSLYSYLPVPEFIIPRSFVKLVYTVNGSNR